MGLCDALDLPRNHYVSDISFDRIEFVDISTMNGDLFFNRTWQRSSTMGCLLVRSMREFKSHSCFRQTCREFIGRDIFCIITVASVIALQSVLEKANVIQ